ncbi:hypothetical protein B566_EDAN004187 [Ephemera danica]|nr:hypothetical protein B566_EDAN004187 [Ephemera danica]
MLFSKSCNQPPLFLEVVVSVGSSGSYMESSSSGKSIRFKACFNNFNNCRSVSVMFSVGSSTWVLGCDRSMVTVILTSAPEASSIFLAFSLSYSICLAFSFSNTNLFALSASRSDCRLELLDDDEGGGDDFFGLVVTTVLPKSVGIGFDEVTVEELEVDLLELDEVVGVDILGREYVKRVTCDKGKMGWTGGGINGGLTPFPEPLFLTFPCLLASLSPYLQKLRLTPFPEPQFLTFPCLLASLSPYLQKLMKKLLQQNQLPVDLICDIDRRTLNGSQLSHCPSGCLKDCCQPGGYEAGSKLEVQLETDLSGCFAMVPVLGGCLSTCLATLPAFEGCFATVTVLEVDAVLESCLPACFKEVTTLADCLLPCSGCTILLFEGCFPASFVTVTVLGGCFAVVSVSGGCSVTAPVFEGCFAVVPVLEGCFVIAPAFKGCFAVIPVLGGCFAVVSVLGGCFAVVPMLGGCFAVVPVLGGCFATASVLEDC